MGASGRGGSPGGDGIGDARGDVPNPGQGLSPLPSSVLLVAPVDRVPVGDADLRLGDAVPAAAVVGVAAGGREVAGLPLLTGLDALVHGERKGKAPNKGKRFPPKKPNSFSTFSLLFLLLFDAQFPAQKISLRGRRKDCSCDQIQRDEVTQHRLETDEFRQRLIADNGVNYFKNVQFFDKRFKANLYPC